MADKAAGKKEQQQQQQQQQKQQPQQQHQQQQKNKKNKKNKKNEENGVKFVRRQWLISPTYAELQAEKYMRKKNKNRKNNINHNKTNHNNNNNINKSSKKNLESKKRSFFWVLLIHLSYVSLFLGFIYIVDYDKFVRIREGATYYVNKTASLLPPEVLSKGKRAVEFIQPVADVTVNKATVFMKEASSFLNTNPLIKDHWTNIREISSICSARLVDYMQTLYLQITGYCNDVKTKFF